MNKGGAAGLGGGAGAGSGPTAAAASAAAQKQKTLLQRVEGDIANIVDNFSHLVNVARVFLSFLLILPTKSSSREVCPNKMFSSPKQCSIHPNNLIHVNHEKHKFLISLFKKLCVG